MGDAYDDDADFDLSSEACRRRLARRNPKPTQNGMGDDDEFDILKRHQQKRKRSKIEFPIDEE